MRSGALPSGSILSGFGALRSDWSVKLVKQYFHCAALALVIARHESILVIAHGVVVRNDRGDV